MKNLPKNAKSVISMFSEHCHGNVYYLNEKHVLYFKSGDIEVLFAIHFSSQFQNSIFHQNPRPKSGLKLPRPLLVARYQYLSFDFILEQRLLH